MLRLRVSLHDRRRLLSLELGEVFIVTSKTTLNDEIDQCLHEVCDDTVV